MADRTAPPETSGLTEAPWSYVRESESVAGGTSHNIDAGGAASRRPLAAVREAAVIGRGAVHVWWLQLQLAGGDGCVQLHLSPVDHVEHQADADDNLWRKMARKVFACVFCVCVLLEVIIVSYANTIFMCFFPVKYLNLIKYMQEVLLITLKLLQISAETIWSTLSHESKETSDHCVNLVTNKIKLTWGTLLKLAVSLLAPFKLIYFSKQTTFKEPSTTGKMLLSHICSTEPHCKALTGWSSIFMCLICFYKWQHISLY